MTNAALLAGLWQGALIAAIAALVTLLLPKRHAATRYAVWFAALLSLAIVPFASFWQLAPHVAALPTPLEHTAAVPIMVTTKATSGAWLLWLWLAGTAFFLLRLGLSHVRIDRIVRHASPAPELGPDVMTSHDVSTPFAAGLFSPVVIVPSMLIESLPRTDLESILQHERAHIRRGDITGNLVQRLVEACLFFNPWVYVIGRQMIKEREAACDDWAVHASGEPHRYASCLARLAQDARRPFPALLTPSAIGSKSMLVGRVARLLDGKVTQLKVNRFVLAASVTAFAVLAVLLQTVNGVASAAVSSLGSTVAANPSPHAGCNQDAAVTDPVMPNIAKADYHENATANALVTVDASGKPVNVKIVKSSGYPAIDDATLKAAESSTYSPKMSNCKATVGSYLFHVQTGPPGQ